MFILFFRISDRSVSSRALEWIVSDPAERVWTGNPELLRLVNVDRLETALRWLANDLAFENRPHLDVHDTDGNIKSARSPYSVRAHLYVSRALAIESFLYYILKIYSFSTRTYITVQYRYYVCCLFISSLDGKIYLRVF